MSKNGPTWILLVAAMVTNVIACGDEDHTGNPNGSQPETRPYVNDPVWPNVRTINAFEGQSYEFKSNCTNVESDELETCFLWTVTAVWWKDFCINSYSGKITKRFVLYGPTGAGLPGPGEYQFLYHEGEERISASPGEAHTRAALRHAAEGYSVHNRYSGSSSSSMSEKRPTGGMK